MSATATSAAAASAAAPASASGRACKIALLPGDGIGPEVVAETVRLLDRVSARAGVTFKYSESLFGGCAIDATGVPLPPETLKACQEAGAVLLGAVGGHKWDNLPGNQRPERGLLDLRKALGLFANLRPIRLRGSLVQGSPLRERVVGDGIDLVIIRELTGGAYYGAKRRSDDRLYAEDVTAYSAAEVDRVARVAFRLAQRRNQKVTSVDKANVLETSRLWRETIEKLAPEFPGVTLDHLYVDNCAMQLVANPRRFDVVVTENLFGDILSDLGGVVFGSLGMLPSASLAEGSKGLYEPVHGSAPDIAGQGIANPIGTIVSAAMMLRFSFELEDEARAIEAAVDRVLDSGLRTKDLVLPVGGSGRVAGTREMTDAILKELA